MCDHAQIEPVDAFRCLECKNVKFSLIGVRHSVIAMKVSKWASELQMTFWEPEISVHEIIASFDVFWCLKLKSGKNADNYSGRNRIAVSGSQSVLQYCKQTFGNSRFSIMMKMYHLMRFDVCNVNMSKDVISMLAKHSLQSKCFQYAKRMFANSKCAIMLKLNQSMHFDV